MATVRKLETCLILDRGDTLKRAHAGTHTRARARSALKQTEI